MVRRSSVSNLKITQSWFDIIPTCSTNNSLMSFTIQFSVVVITKIGTMVNIKLSPNRRYPPTTSLKVQEAQHPSSLSVE